MLRGVMHLVRLFAFSRSNRWATIRSESGGGWPDSSLLREFVQVNRTQVLGQPASRLLRDRLERGSNSFRGQEARGNDLIKNPEWPMAVDGLGVRQRL